MSDLRDVFKGFIAASAVVAKQERLNQLADQAIKRSKCGDCVYWMISSCPKEKRERGYSVGPSAGSPICDKFAEKQWSIDLRNERLQAVKDYCDEHNLPWPSYLPVTVLDSSSAIKSAINVSKP